MDLRDDGQGVRPDGGERRYLAVQGIVQVRKQVVRRGRQRVERRRPLLRQPRERHVQEGVEVEAQRAVIDVAEEFGRWRATRHSGNTLLTWI